jgi:hypothetical protein
MKKMITPAAKWAQIVANFADDRKIRVCCEISARERFKIRDYLL